MTGTPIEILALAVVVIIVGRTLIWLFKFLVELPR